MRTLSISGLLALLAGALLLGGCEEDPGVIRTDQVYTLYGYLDPTADRQALRVVPIAPTLGADTARTIDAAVVSTERGSGREVAWRDSVVTYADGSVGHVFVADYTPAPGETVDVVVTEGGGPEPRAASVEVDVPMLSQSRVLTASASGSQVSYLVEIRGVPNVIGGTLRIYATGLPAAPTDTTVLTIPEVNANVQEVAPGDWRLTIPFLSATRAYLQSQGLLNTLTLLGAEYGTFVANDAWAVPGGGLDLDAIVEPGTFSNVTGGFGFVGAGYEAPVRWLPSLATQARAGFRISEDPASQLTINEISLTADGWVEIYNPTVEPIEVGGYAITQDPGGGSVEITGRATIPARGFLVVETDLTFQAGDRVGLESPGGTGSTTTFIASDANGTAQAYGSFPDGRREFFNLGGGTVLFPFQGTLTPTRGAPNVIDLQPAAINEISTAGSSGWVEAITLPGAQVNSVFVASIPELILRADGAAPGPPDNPFLVVTEGSEALVLEQTGGEVYLLANYEIVEAGSQSRVVDYRQYGPQDPTRSTGYLPDGPSGTWRDGLVPTRGGPNAATGRLGTR